MSSYIGPNGYTYTPIGQGTQGSTTNSSSLGSSDLYGIDPRDANGQPVQRDAGGQLIGALTGIDAFSDINAMRNPAMTQFQAGGVDPGRGAYAMPGQYNQSLAQALAAAQGGRSMYSMQAANAQGARLGPLAQAQFRGGQAALGNLYAQSQGYSAGGPQMFDPAQAQAAQMGFAQANAAQMRGAQINQGASNQWRGQQQSLAQALQARASGQAPSAAEQQLQQGMGQAINAQVSQAASARGMSRALANRQASQGIAQVQAQTNAQTAQLRAQEQAQAEQTLGGFLTGAREQDIGLAGQQAQLGQAASQFNAANRQQVNLANAGFTQEAMGQNAGFQQQVGLQNAGWQQQAGLQGQSLAAQMAMQNAQMGQQNSQFNATNKQQLYMQNLANQQQMGLANLQYGSQYGLANMQAANQYNQFGAQLGQQNAQFNAGLQQQAGMQNQQAYLQQQQINNQNYQNLLSQGMSQEQAQAQLYSQYYQMLAQQQSSNNNINAQIAMQNTQNQNKANAGILGMAGSALGSIFSDERVKKNIRPADRKDLREFLASVEPSQFEYKDPAYGAPGERYGVIAQDLERSKVGRSLIRETPDGTKTIDTAQGFGAVLAAQRDLQERLDAIESGSKGKLLANRESASTNPELMRRDAEMSARMTPEQARRIMPMSEFFAPPRDGGGASPPPPRPSAPSSNPELERAFRLQQALDATRGMPLGSQRGEGVQPIPSEWSHYDRSGMPIGLPSSMLQPGDLASEPQWPDMHDPSVQASYEAWRRKKGKRS